MSLVPSNVDSVVRAGFGERGRRWLADLPKVVAKCCRDWELEIIGPAMEGGTHSYAAPVMWGGTQPAVLKIPVTDEENRAEAGALYCYDGEGAVQLYAYDPESAGMLLEWARPGRPLVPVDPRVHREGLDEHFDDVAVACELYRRLWRVPGPLPDGFAGFESAVDVVAGWPTRCPRRSPNIPTRLRPTWWILWRSSADVWPHPTGRSGWSIVTLIWATLWRQNVNRGY